MKKIEAGEMYGFRVVNTFPDTCTDEEWTEFADSVSRILDKSERKTRLTDAEALD